MSKSSLSSVALVAGMVVALGVGVSAQALAATAPSVGMAIGVSSSSSVSQKAVASGIGYVVPAGIGQTDAITCALSK